MDTNIDNTMTANTGDNTDCRNGSKFDLHKWLKKTKRSIS